MAERKPGKWVTGDAEDFLNDEGRPMERKTEQRCGRPGCACTCHMAESERARYLLSGAMPFGAEVCICPLPTESETERETFDCLACGDSGYVNDEDGFMWDCPNKCAPAPSETPSPEVAERVTAAVLRYLIEDGDEVHAECPVTECELYGVVLDAIAAAKEQSK